jgi:hypothetical protein
MHSKALIRLAKEIKINFQLILIALVCTLVTYGILYYSLKPPISNQVEELSFVEIDAPIEEEYAPTVEEDVIVEEEALELNRNSSATNVGAYSTLQTLSDIHAPDEVEEWVLPPDFGASRYDSEATTQGELDNLNWFREIAFRSDLEEKTAIAFFLFFFGLCGGRYLFLFVRWVNRTSQLE